MPLMHISEFDLINTFLCLLHFSQVSCLFYFYCLVCTEHTLVSVLETKLYQTLLAEQHKRIFWLLNITTVTDSDLELLLPIPDKSRTELEQVPKVIMQTCIIFCLILFGFLFPFNFDSVANALMQFRCIILAVDSNTLWLFWHLQLSMSHLLA